MRISELKNFSVNLIDLKSAKVVNKTLEVTFKDNTIDKMPYDTENEANNNYNKLIKDWKNLGKVTIRSF